MANVQVIYSALAADFKLRGSTFRDLHMILSQLFRHCIDKFGRAWYSNFKTGIKLLNIGCTLQCPSAAL